MIKAGQDIRDAISKVEGKGDPIVSAGTTGSGKSTVETACARHYATQSLLAIREASGKGSIANTSMVVTDYEAIPEDKLIVIGGLNRKTQAECGDDNELLGNIVYSAAKDYDKNEDKNSYKAKLAEALAFQPLTNDSLAYKIKDISEDDRNALIKVILELPIPQVMDLYHEWLAKNKKKGQKGVRIFIELLSACESFKETIKKFWDMVVEDFINRDVEELKAKLEVSGAYVENKPEGGYKFIAILEESDIGSEIVDTLLKSEQGSKEYLFSDFSLIFRGADHVFDVPKKDALTVSEIGGKKIHCVRIIDTKGLFHGAGAKPKEEAERIVDLLSEYHSTRLLLTVNSLVNNTVKDGYEAITAMLQEANREIEVYILYTHWDEYLRSFGNKENEENKVNRFGGERVSIDWGEKFEIARTEQKKLLDCLTEAVKSNSSRRKPQIIKAYKAAFVVEEQNSLENVLVEEDIFYNRALNDLFSDIAAMVDAKCKRYRVIEGVEKSVSIPHQSAQQNISALYNNLVTECKGLRLYAATVRACIRKWCEAGGVHISEVIENDNGFKDIKTLFVQEIRNYAMLYANKLNLNVAQYLPNPNDADGFVNDLTAFWANQQGIGREVAKIIGNEAYEKGFMNSTGFKYQYEHFEDMLQYVQTNYFNQPLISFSERFENCLLEAAKKCIRDFVDSRCIVVY